MGESWKTYIVRARIEGAGEHCELLPGTRGHVPDMCQASRKGGGRRALCGLWKSGNKNGGCADASEQAGLEQARA